MSYNSDKTKILISSFSREMATAMDNHAEKGDWADRPIMSFFPEFLKEAHRMFDALDKRDFDAVGKACVNMSNYSMMLASRVGYIHEADSGLSPAK